MAPLIPWIESAKVGSKSLAYVIWPGSDIWGDRIHCVIFYGDEATMYIRARASTYIYIYISTRNGRIQNGWTGPVFRHYRGQAVWIQSGNKLKKGTVVALANKLLNHAQLGRLQTN